jgi:hypothetical protein
MLSSLPPSYFGWHIKNINILDSAHIVNFFLSSAFDVFMALMAATALV